MELQQTIGYGSRVPGDQVRIGDHWTHDNSIYPQCVDVIVLQGLQTIVGMLVDAALVGIFFAKVARPGRRARTVIFSKNAVITTRDGVRCLIWQVADVQMSPLVETHFRAQIRTTHVTREGEILHNHMRLVENCLTEFYF